MRRPRGSQSGFSLIELMVSLVLFSFALAGVLAIAVSMAQGFREQRKVIETETAARGALDYIADGLRMTSPAVTTAVVRLHAGANLTIDSTFAIGAVEDTMGPVGVCPTGSVKVVNNGGLNNSDILEIVMASGPVITTMTNAWTNASTFIDVTDTSNLAEGDQLLITNGSEARIVRVDDIPSPTRVNLLGYNCTATNPISGSFLPGSLVLRVMRARFYLDTNVADAIPTVLYMDPDGDGDLDPEPLADYVEDFQVAIGIDEDGDDAVDPDEWLYAPGTVTNPFTPGKTLHAIRVTLVARASSSLTGTAPSYRRPAVEDHVAATANDTFRRRVLSSTVEIRNLGDSP